MVRDFTGVPIGLLVEIDLEEAKTELRLEEILDLRHADSFNIYVNDHYKINKKLMSKDCGRV